MLECRSLGKDKADGEQGWWHSMGSCAGRGAAPRELSHGGVQSRALLWQCHAEVECMTAAWRNAWVINQFLHNMQRCDGAGGLFLGLSFAPPQSPSWSGRGLAELKENFNAMVTLSVLMMGNVRAIMWVPQMYKASCPLNRHHGESSMT